MWYEMAKRDVNKDLSGDGRVFIAIWLPREARKALDHIEDLADDLHMTVVYITEGIDSVPARRQVLDAVEEVCKRTRPIDCKLTEMGVMGNEEKTLVANVTVMDGSKFYTDLIDTIERKIGRKVERDYDFLPHVSVREKSGDGEADIKDLRKFGWTANQITVQFGDDTIKHRFSLTGGRRVSA